MAQRLQSIPRRQPKVQNVEKVRDKKKQGKK